MKCVNTSVWHQGHQMSARLRARLVNGATFRMVTRTRLSERGTRRRWMNAVAVREGLRGLVKSVRELSLLLCFHPPLLFFALDT